MEWSWGMSEYSEYSECSDFQNSHRFNKIQQKDYLWKFVLICGRKKHLFNPLKSINTNFLNPYILSLVDLLTRWPVDFILIVKKVVWYAPSSKNCPSKKKVV